VTGPTVAPAPNAARAAGAPPSWHDDALRLGAALDHVAAALVVGRDGDAAAWAALGAARAQAARRRVAVADLVGDAAALADLGEGDEPVGLSDSFFYGVTLNKIARPADADGALFVLPSGSEPVAVEEVLSSDRWRRLVAGFREAGALLVLAAQADAPGLAALAARVDGLVVVGDLGGLLPDAPAPLMVIPTSRRGRAARAADESAPGAPGDPVGRDGAPTFAEQFARATAAPAATTAGAGAPHAPAELDAANAADGPAVRDDRAAVARPRPATTAEARPASKAGAGSRRAVVGALLALAAAAAGAVLWSRRPAAGGAARPAAATRADTAAGRLDGGAPNGAPAGRDSAGGAAALPPAAPVDLAAALAVRNPADSGRAAAFTLYLAGASTAEGATLAGADSTTATTAALTPQLEDGAPWWRLFVGAYPTRQRAEAALAGLRERGVVGSGSGAVVRAPYALLVGEGLAAADASARADALARRGVRTYALARGDGTVALYAGAFERPADAAYLGEALKAAGVAPALVFRTGEPAAAPNGGGGR
jgi:hypothetical protein